jgi:hypothetical protein
VRDNQSRFSWASSEIIDWLYWPDFSRETVIAVLLSRDYKSCDRATRGWSALAGAWWFQFRVCSFFLRIKKKELENEGESLLNWKLSITTTLNRALHVTLSYFLIMSSWVFCCETEYIIIRKVRRLILA